MRDIFLLAIAGGSASGKSTLARQIAGKFNQQQCQIVEQDSYYIDQSHRFDGDGGQVNFDHPAALDFDLLAQHLTALRRGEGIELPCYDFVSHQRLAKTRHLKPCPLMIFDGTLILHHPQVREQFDHRLFLAISDALRFERRKKRDIQQRGRTEEGVVQQYQKQVRPMYQQFVLPCAAYAEQIFYSNQEVEQHLDSLVTLLQKHLLSRDPGS